MKDYKRLTDKYCTCPACKNGKCTEPRYDCEEREYCVAWNRLFELEDKIESGELCYREEVRKETAREVLDKVYAAVEHARLECEFQDDKGNWLIDEGEFLSEFTLGKLHELYAEYGFELFGNSDKLEDEE